MVNRTTPINNAAKGDQFIFVLDDSLSMRGPSCNEKTRLEVLKEHAKAAAATAVQYDPDGVDVITFGKGKEIKFFNNLSGQAVNRLIDFMAGFSGGTDTAGAIRQARERIQAIRTTNNIHVLVITDGEVKDQAVVDAEMRALNETLINGKKLNVTYVQIAGNQCVEIKKTECETGEDGKCIVQGITPVQLPPPKVHPAPPPPPKAVEPPPPPMRVLDCTDPVPSTAQTYPKLKCEHGFMISS